MWINGIAYQMEPLYRRDRIGQMLYCLTKTGNRHRKLDAREVDDLFAWVGSSPDSFSAAKLRVWAKADKSY